MKSLTIFLTLVVLAGSQAAPVSSLSQLDNVLWEYIPTVYYNITQEHLDALRNSEQGQEISKLVLNTVNTIKTTQAELTEEVQKLGQRLTENMQPHAQELKEKVEVLLGEWQQKLVAAFSQAQEGLMVQTEPLRQTLTNITEELVQKMEQSAESILGTSSEAMKAKFQKLNQDFRQKMQQQFQGPLRRLRVKLQQFHRTIYSYTEALPSDLVNFARNTVNSLLQFFQ